MRRIYLEIYLSVVGAALLVTLVLSVFGHWYFEGRLERELASLTASGVRILAALPPDASRAALDDALGGLARAEGVTAVLRDANGEILAAAGPGVGPGLHAGLRERHRGRLPRDATPRQPGRGGPGSGPPHRTPPPWAWTSLETPDGGLLELASAEPWRRPRGGGPWLFAGVFLATIALAAYPVARRISRGLEKLREGVSELGDGDLSARIEIEGRNEVADVARAFNAAAEKIQRGVEAQRRVLASASHELRSPLGRLRAAVELLAAGHHDRLEEAERDIEELDGLIEDLLLTARLDAAPATVRRDPVDLEGLAGEEAARVGATISGSAPPLLGDPRLLRRLVRNLLENARRHGSPPIALTLSGDTSSGAVVIRVSDAGGGPPPSERERIFEPFYRPAGHSETRDGGVGLGLALVADIAVHHGGEARCVDDGQGGSVFVVRLPTAG